MKSQPTPVSLFPAEFSSKSLLRRKLRGEWQRFFWLLSVRIPPIAWRLFEIAAAALLAILLIPILLPLYIIAKLNGGGIRRTVRLGLDAKEFEEFSLRFSPGGAPANALLRYLGRLPAVANVFSADMSLVGPRTLSRTDIAFDDRSVWKRFGMRPGFVGLWWVRKQANIAYEREALIDEEYADTKSIGKDLGILFRSVPAAFYGGAALPAGRKIMILNVPIDNVSMDEATGQIIDSLSQPAPLPVCFVNADCVNIAQRDAGYVALLESCPLVLADGIGLKLASNLLGTPICQNVNGTDLIPRLCAKLAGQGGSVYLLGGKPGVADDVAAWMLKTFPGLRIAGHHHGYFASDETAAITSQIQACSPDVLLVAMGAPRQERWIQQHLVACGAKAAIGVGGLFDFYSGRVDRAPVWVRELGMEWLFRLLKEPGRMWKRYLLGNIAFVLRILARRLHLTRPARSCT